MRPLLVFDGDCGFCTASARWVEARTGAAMRVEPWQVLDLDELGLTEADVTAAAWLIEPDGTRRRGHEAIGGSLRRAGGPWRLIGSLLLIPPVSWLARPVYALVARNRHRLPGATDACRIDA